MPERGCATESWNADEWFQDISRDQRYLFWYLWSNDHCTPAGMYHITLTTIVNESKLTREEVTDLLPTLQPKVKWYPEANLIWIKSFIKRQSKSSKFIAAAAKSLLSVNCNGAVEELLQHNLEKYSISIPYQYYIDKVSILAGASPVPGPVPGSEKEGGGLGEGEEKPSEDKLGPAVDDKEVISVWGSVKGFDQAMRPDECIELMASLRAEFPDVDILAESKAWKARKISDPLKAESRPSGQIWNWMKRARQFREEQGRGQPKRSTGKDIQFKRCPVCKQVVQSCICPGGYLREKMDAKDAAREVKGAKSSSQD